MRTFTGEEALQSLASDFGSGKDNVTPEKFVSVLLSKRYGAHIVSVPSETTDLLHACVAGLHELQRNGVIYAPALKAHRF